MQMPTLDSGTHLARVGKNTQSPLQYKYVGFFISIRTTQARGHILYLDIEAQTQSSA